MKTRENITMFQCDFCSKRMIRKHAMTKHEEHCYSNPKNKAACSGCAFLMQETIEIEHPGYIFKSKAFRCTKLDKGVYPYKVVKKGILQKHPETFEDQIQMPQSCDLFEFEDNLPF